VVLILGRFSAERKAVLDAVRVTLRQLNYVPIIFDFVKPTSKDLTETVTTLANMARFIVADLTDPSSIPHELASVIPQVVTPVQPILLKGQREYAMFADLRLRYDKWVLPTWEYNDAQHLLENLKANVVAPAERRASELNLMKNARA
jgi:hypothetical protein